MDKKDNKELEYTLKFIADVKESDFIKNKLSEIPVNPRMDEPSTHQDDEDLPILSFSN